MAGGLSGYETPSFIYAAVLAFFLIMALLIEKVLELVEHYIDELGRNGLKSALHSVIKEVMMVGFISLILTVIETPLSEICVNRFSQHDTWVSVSYVDECNECLKDTRGLSSTYKEEHQCPFWQEDETDSHYGKGKEKVEHHRRLMAGGGDDVCDEGKEVLVSVALLHEAHIAIFLLTVVHVFNVVIMVLTATYRLRRWKRFELRDGNVCAALHEAYLEPFVSPDEMPDSVRVQLHTEIDIATEAENGTPDGISQDNDGSTVTIRDRFRIWRHAFTIPRNDDFKKAKRTMTEWAISLFKQFVRPVTQQGFRIMRAAFMLAHKRRAETFDFMDYLTKALDDDVCEVVKISPGGWITLTLAVLLWPPATNSGWVVLACTLVFVCAVLIICAKLILVVRHVTREERVNDLDPGVFWFGRPRLLLPVVRYTLFVNSAIFAIMASLAIEYGPRSCIFVGNHGDGRGQYGSWILVILLNTLSFLHISFIMLPTYSLVVHMGSTHWSHHLIGADIKEKLLDWRNRATTAEGSTRGSQRKTH